LIPATEREIIAQGNIIRIILLTIQSYWKRMDKTMDEGTDWILDSDLDMEYF
jgi:hypothetical protein